MYFSEFAAGIGQARAFGGCGGIVTLSYRRINWFAGKLRGWGTLVAFVIYFPSDANFARTR
jgi:hypothetical protein